MRAMKRIDLYPNYEETSMHSWVSSGKEDKKIDILVLFVIFLLTSLRHIR